MTTNQITEKNHQPIQTGNNLFPVFLKLNNKNILIVGGGNVAHEKLNALLQNSPDIQHITIVATTISDNVRKTAAQYPVIHLIEKPFENSDLDDADVIISAVNDKETSKHIYISAKQKNKLINVADKPELCDFYLSSVVKKGNLKIAISTNGKSPTIAKRLKEVLNDSLPEELDEVLANLNKIRNKLNGNFTDKVKKLNSITKVLADKKNIEEEHRWKMIASYSVIALGLMMLGHFVFSYIPLKEIAFNAVAWYNTLDDNFHWILLAGFLAQLVDGALGMGYGLTSATILLSAGISPASISASIHTAEMFASGASGYSHYKFGNVNKKLFKALVIPGVIGAITGAILLTHFGDANAGWLRIILACYTLFLGVKFLINAFRKYRKPKKFKRHGWLAAAGGFLDSFGGGGWGPLVTTTLINKGRNPKYVIGSVSLTEFFVTLASAFTFFTLIGVTHWQVILALVIGGLIAAPIGAKLTGKIPRKSAYILIGILVIIWSIRILMKAF